MDNKHPRDPEPVVALTMTQLQELIQTATQAQPDMTGVAEAITTGLAQARKPIPENDISDGISAANPLGDRDHPRPGTKCEMWMGVISDKDGTVQRVSRYEPNDLTAWEQLALNLLEPLEQVVLMLDGAQMPVKVVAHHHDITGAVMRLTIGLPFKHLQAQSQTMNMIPPIVDLVHQLTGHNLRPPALSLDELAWLMAEHRAGRYVGPRTTVAA